MAKVMRKGPHMQRRDQASWGPPGTSQPSTPKPESVCLIILLLSPTPMTLTGAIPDHPSLEKVNLELVHMKGVSLLKPL